MKLNMSSVRRTLRRGWRDILQRHLGRLMNFYPPFLGAGIRIEHADPDYRRLVIAMDLAFYNQNFVGTHFGGSLFAMTDPFYMLMLIHNLGDDYIVWDKGATIRFRKPGRGRVRVEFVLTDEQLDDIRQRAEREAKLEPVFTVQILDEAGDVVAEVDKTLYIRKKSRAFDSATANEHPS